jgi:hypothetical protein
MKLIIQRSMDMPCFGCQWAIHCEHEGGHAEVRCRGMNKRVVPKTLRQCDMREGVGKRLYMTGDRLNEFMEVEPLIIDPNAGHGYL